MPATLDLHGRRFNRLLVLERAPKISRLTRWKCQCDCGRFTTVVTGKLTNGHTQSCGCLKRERIADAHRTHGMAHTREYAVWRAMRQRCDNPNLAAYPNYGGRGIKVCDHWTNFANFLADVGTRPTAYHTLDRIDNDGPYSPENVRWATYRQQSSNTRVNRRLTMDGQTHTIAEWSERTGITPGAIWVRLSYGWSVERTLTEPVNPKRQHRRLQRS